MLTLYYRPSCPYCKKVLAAAQLLGTTFHLKDIDVEEVHAIELMALGGKHQVPFLVDAPRGVKLYESDDIIAYITEKHGGQKSEGTVRVHKSTVASNVCS
jgi:glutathione S-transferase